MSAFIVGFTGPAGVGKDAAAGMLIHELRAMSITAAGVAFATPIKDMAAALLRAAGASVSDIEACKRDRDARPLPGVDITMRRILQTLGTEWGRELVDEELWIKVLLSRVDRLPFADVVVVPDVRFENEARALKERGGMIVRVERDVEPVEAHASETPLPEELVDVVVDNSGSLDDLHREMIALARVVMGHVRPAREGGV